MESEPEANKVCIHQQEVYIDILYYPWFIIWVNGFHNLGFSPQDIKNQLFNWHQKYDDLTMDIWYKEWSAYQIMDKIFLHQYYVIGLNQLFDLLLLLIDIT